jgi:hypothetical protein
LFILVLLHCNDSRGRTAFDLHPDGHAGHSAPAAYCQSASAIASSLICGVERDLAQRKARGMPHNAPLVPGNKKD